MASARGMTKTPILALLAAGLLAACEPSDTSALQEIEETVAGARETVDLANARAAQVQQAVENPLGTLQSVAGTRLARAPTNQAGVFVLTDLTTGCQFLAAYGPDNTTVTSITPRTEPAEGGALRQRCILPSETSSGEADETAGGG